MSRRLVCFDLYDTLITSLRPIQTHQAIAAAVAQRVDIDVNIAKRILYPVIWEGRDKSRIQRPVIELIRFLSVANGLNEVQVKGVEEAYSSQVGDEWHGHQASRPAVEYLKMIANSTGIETAIISNCLAPRAEILRMLSRLELLPLLSEVFLSSDGRGKKPQESWFADIESHFSLSPQQCLMIGDSELTDLNPAQTRGWRVRLITSPTDWRDLTCQFHNNTSENHD